MLLDCIKKAHIIVLIDINQLHWDADNVGSVHHMVNVPLKGLIV